MGQPKEEAPKKPQTRKKPLDADYNPEEDEDELSEPESDASSPRENAKKPKESPRTNIKGKPAKPESNRARINRMKEGFMPFEIPKGTTLQVHVIDVYDGDTITGRFELWGQKFWASFRLTGLDTAEKKLS